jgi:hypothetical protein
LRRKKTSADEISAVGTSDDETPASRAQLQQSLRRARKKAKKHRHRWRRRIIYSLSFILLLGVLGAGGLYYYVGYRFNQIKKIHAPHLVKAAPPGKPFDMLMVGSDSRAFVGDNSTLSNELGNAANEGGPAQRRHHGGPLRPRHQNGHRALHSA